MTVVCFKEGILAADRLICDHWDVRAGFETKIFKRNDAFYGFAGPRSEIQIWIDWYFSVRDPHSPPPALNDGISCLCIKSGEVWRAAGKTPYLAKTEIPFTAIGSGAHIALGAMWMGATAEQAVQAAIALDTGCGGPIDVLRCVEDVTAAAAAQSERAIPALVGQINPNPIRDPYAEIFGTHFGGPR